MRFFNSSALAKAPKLRFAANCSAAEAMSGFLPPPFASPGPQHLRDRQRMPGIIWGPASIKSIVPWADRPPPKGLMTQMLRRFACFLGARQDLHGAAGLIDRLDRGLGSAVDLDIDLGLDLAAAEQPHAALGAAQDASLHQRLGVDDAARIERLGVDRLLEAV